VSVSLPDLSDAVSASDLIFGGTVIELGASSVANLPAKDNFAVVRVERVYLSGAALGNLIGKRVTVALLDSADLNVNDRFIFLTVGWIFGAGIATREVTHKSAQNESEIEAEVALIPEHYLAKRLANALLVATANVTQIGQIPFDITWRNAPQWEFAYVSVGEVLSGKAPRVVTVLFPSSNRPTWVHAPRLQRGQRSIFILHGVPDWTVSPKTPRVNAFTALDPADVQPESKRALIEKLLSQMGRP